MCKTCTAVKLWDQKASLSRNRHFPNLMKAATQNSLYEVNDDTGFESIYPQILRVANTEAKLQHMSLKHHTNIAFSLLQRSEFTWGKKKIYNVKNTLKFLKRKRAVLAKEPHKNPSSCRHLQKCKVH